MCPGSWSPFPGLVTLWEDSGTRLKGRLMAPWLERGCRTGQPWGKVHGWRPWATGAKVFRLLSQWTPRGRVWSQTVSNCGNTCEMLPIWEAYWRLGAQGLYWRGPKAPLPSTPRGSAGAQHGPRCSSGPFSAGSPSPRSGDGEKLPQCQVPDADQHLPGKQLFLRTAVLIWYLHSFLHNTQFSFKNDSVSQD